MRWFTQREDCDAQRCASKRLSCKSLQRRHHEEALASIVQHEQDIKRWSLEVAERKGSEQKAEDDGRGERGGARIARATSLVLVGQQGSGGEVASLLHSFDGSISGAPCLKIE